MRRHLPDILFLMLAALIGALAIVGTLNMAPAFYDPLGAGAFPRWIGVIVLVLVALKAATLLIAVRTSGALEQSSPLPRLHWRMTAMFALMIAFLATLWSGLADFPIATTVFLALGVLLLVPRRTPLLVLLVVLGSGLGALAMDYIFHTVFFLDL